jgi:hypothetical protein
MALLKRFDALEVATSDLGDAVRTYQSNFGFELRPGCGGDTATLRVGGAEIRLVAGAATAATITASGEGLAGLWLETEDLQQVVAALKSAGFEAPSPKIDQERRVIAIDAKIANHVPLFIFDRKV